MSELDSCKLVSEEYPSICGRCHTDRCGSIPSPTPPASDYRCGCRSCTPDILDLNADGHSCGARIDWLVQNKGMSELDSCKLVSEEYPSICGRCHTDRCGSVFPPSPTPPSTNDCSVNGCSHGQICVINHTNGVLKSCDGSNTSTIQSGKCHDLSNTKRIWAGPDDSNCYSPGVTLFECTYPAHNRHSLAWNLST